MNKYQGALDRLNLQENWQEGNELQTLQELVDKETPKKPNFTPNSSFSYCKKCKKPIHWATGTTVYETIKYCKFCGQRIDWANDEA